MRGNRLNYRMMKVVMRMNRSCQMRTNSCLKIYIVSEEPDAKVIGESLAGGGWGLMGTGILCIILIFEFRSQLTMGAWRNGSRVRFQSSRLPVQVGPSSFFCIAPL